MVSGRRSPSNDASPAQIEDLNPNRQKGDSAQNLLQEFASYCAQATPRPEARNDRRRAQDWAPEDYNNKISQLFEATNQNLDQALLKSAAEGKPVVMMFGSRNSRQCQQMLDSMARSEHLNYRGWITMVYVDIDSVDANSNIGKMVGKCFHGGAGAYKVPSTFVFTQHPGPDGKPVPDRPVVLSGARDARAFANDLAREVPRLQEIQQRYVFPQRPADSATPVAPPPPEVAPVNPKVQELKPAAGGTIFQIHKEVFDDLRQANRAEDPKERERLYRLAIEAADKLNPQDIRQEAERLKKEYQESMTRGGNDDKTREIVRQILSLKDMSQAAGFTRANLGLHLIREGQPAEGFSWILAAGSRNPDMYNDPNFARALAKAGYPPEATQALIAAGRANPNFYMQNGFQPEPILPANGGRTFNPGPLPDTRIPESNQATFRPGFPQPGFVSPTRPGYPQPGAYSPGAFNSGYPQPGAYSPGAFNSGYPQPGAYSQGTFNPGYAQPPGAFNQGTFNPGYAQPPGAYNQGTFSPGYAQPGYNPNTFRPTPTTFGPAGFYPQVNPSQSLPLRPGNPLSARLEKIIR